MLKPWLPVWQYWRWSLRKMIRFRWGHKGVAHLMGFCPCKKRSESSLLLSLSLSMPLSLSVPLPSPVGAQRADLVRTQQEDGHLQARKSSHQNPTLFAPDLGLYSLWNCEERHFCHWNPPNLLLWHPKLRERPTPYSLDSDRPRSHVQRCWNRAGEPSVLEPTLWRPVAWRQKKMGPSTWMLGIKGKG